MVMQEIATDRNQKELRAHGTFEFPIAVYKRQPRNSVLGYVNWHWHDEMQFCLVTAGSVTVFLNQRSVTLTKGQGMFINVGVLHMIKDLRGCETEPGEYVCVVISRRILTAFPNSIMDRKYVKPIVKTGNPGYLVFDGKEGWHRKILDGVLHAYREFEKKEYGYEMEICGQLMLVWKQMVTGFSGSVHDDGGRGVDHIREQRLRDIVEYIGKHYEEKISLEDVAGSVHLSVNECCRFFKRSMNCTIVEYITEFRLGKSIEMLNTSDLTVGQIACDCGFGTSSYYIDKFKKKMGMTPGEFRRASEEAGGSGIN